MCKRKWKFTSNEKVDSAATASSTGTAIKPPFNCLQNSLNLKKNGTSTITTNCILVQSVN